MNRIEQEKQVILKIITIYCNKHKHTTDKKLCEECDALYQYAVTRLNHCKFGEAKTFCSKCPIHCYKKNMRDKMKAVMRFSGPRLFIYHPILVIKHILS